MSEEPIHLTLFQVFELIESTKSMPEKINILKSFIRVPEMHTILDVVLNNSVKHHIHLISKDIPPPNSFSFNEYQEDIPEISYESLMALSNQLNSKTLSKKQRLQLVWKFLSACTEFEQKWCVRVINKNLRMGVSNAMAVRAGFKTRKFLVMLAMPDTAAINLEKEISKGWLISNKYDGYRCIAICSYGQVELFTREGVRYENLPQLKEELSSICQFGEFVLDGELMSTSFQGLQRSLFSSVNKIEVQDLKYKVFDLLSGDEWREQKFITPAKDRYEQLQGMISNAENLVYTEYVEKKMMYSLSSVYAARDKAIAEGYEGVMANAPNRAYHLGRDWNVLLKFKKTLSQDCRVIGRFEGEGSLENTLGGLVVIQENGKRCKVGLGLTREMRDTLWHMDEKDLIGRIVEVKYQFLTDKQIMRFPVFLRVRDTGPGTGKV